MADSDELLLEDTEVEEAEEVQQIVTGKQS